MLFKHQFNYWCSLFFFSSSLTSLAQETQKAKQFLPFLQRAGRSEAVVEYVFSGSRLKLYMPKETCLITFLLAGKCQSAPACQLRHHLWPHNDHNVAADRCCTTSLMLCFVGFFKTSRNGSPKKNNNSVAIFSFSCHCSHLYNKSGQWPETVKLKKKKKNIMKVLHTSRYITSEAIDGLESYSPKTVLKSCLPTIVTVQCGKNCFDILL